MGGLCCCRTPGGCIPYPESPGYGNPRNDSRGYLIATVPAGKYWDQPVALTKQEIRRELRRFPDRKYGDVCGSGAHVHRA